MSKFGSSVEICVSWTKCQGGYIPDNAVEAGPDVFVARCEYNPGEWVPGKACAGHPTAFIAYGPDAIPIGDYEVLVHTSTGCYGQGTEWVSSSGGEVPKRAIIGGNSPDGEPQYIARGFVNGDICAGKVHPSHGVGYFAWGSESFSLPEYDVLTCCKHAD